MKAAQMIQPDEGPQFRDIESAVVRDQWYMTLTLTCGHKKDLSRYQYKRHKDDAELCMECRR